MTNKSRTTRATLRERERRSNKMSLRQRVDHPKESLGEGDDSNALSLNQLMQIGTTRHQIPRSVVSNVDASYISTVGQEFRLQALQLFQTWFGPENSPSPKNPPTIRIEWPSGSTTQYAYDYKKRTLIPALEINGYVKERHLRKGSIVNFDNFTIRVNNTTSQNLLDMLLKVSTFGIEDSSQIFFCSDLDTPVGVADDPTLRTHLLEVVFDPKKEPLQYGVVRSNILSFKHSFVTLENPTTRQLETGQSCWVVARPDEVQNLLMTPSTGTIEIKRLRILK